MPRLFSALEIPADVGERLALLRGGLMGARWVDPENYHITLRFAGDIDDPTAHELSSALASISMPSFDLMLDGLGSFGNRKPRSVWAGVPQNDALLALQRANERAAQKIGLPPEARNFHPHVTLARMRNGKAPPVAKWLEQQGGFFSVPFHVERFVLYSSRASTGGGPYVIEETFPLT